MKSSLPSEVCEDDTPLVWRWRNEIFFHADVDDTSCKKLIQCVCEFKDDHHEVSHNKTSKASLTIRISSNGGCAFAGLMLYDYLTSLGAEINLHTISQGICASAATFIFLAGVTRSVTPFSHVLIHQIRVADQGYQTLHRAKEEMLNSERVQGAMRRLYEETTTIPKKRLDELFRSEVYLNPEDCYDYGISTEPSVNALKKRKR